MNRTTLTAVRQYGGLGVWQVGVDGGDGGVPFVQRGEGVDAKRGELPHVRQRRIA